MKEIKKVAVHVTGKELQTLMHPCVTSALKECDLCGNCCWGQQQ